MPETALPSPKKVIFTLPSFAAGGAERVLITLMNGLDREKFSPELICLANDGPLRSLVADDIPVHAKRTFQRVAYGLPFLLKTLRKHKPDIIVSTMAHMNFGVLLVAPFLSKRIKVIVREAITPSFLLDHHKDAKLIRLLYRFLYPRARQVICPAQCIIDEFKTHLDIETQNFRLLYNPVNTQKIRGATNGTDVREPLHFICAGRLHFQKGFDRLIEALPALQDMPSWHLTILGEGDEREALQNLVNHHSLQDRITLAGFSSEPWPAIGSADCFLLPSRHEGLPNVALESLCVGTPVIAMDTAGGIAEIAALAQSGSVTLCTSMNEFVDAMRNVSPLPRTEKTRESLLPVTFHPNSVEETFMALLDQAA